MTDPNRPTTSRTSRLQGLRQPYLGRANEQRARQGAYALVNASVTWTDPTDHYYSVSGVTI